MKQIRGGTVDRSWVDKAAQGKRLQGMKWNFPQHLQHALKSGKRQIGL